MQQLFWQMTLSFSASNKKKFTILESFPFLQIFPPLDYRVEIFCVSFSNLVFLTPRSGNLNNTVFILTISLEGILPLRSLYLFQHCEAETIVNISCSLSCSDNKKTRIHQNINNVLFPRSQTGAGGLISIHCRVGLTGPFVGTFFSYSQTWLTIY